MTARLRATGAMVSSGWVTGAQDPFTEDDAVGGWRDVRVMNGAMAPVPQLKASTVMGQGQSHASWSLPPTGATTFSLFFPAYTAPQPPVALGTHHSR